jgi:hypothetical protein
MGGIYTGNPHFPMLTKVYYIIKNLIVDKKHREIILTVLVELN